MENLTYYSVPKIFEIFFLVFIMLPVLLISLLVRKGVSVENRNATFWVVVSTLFIYFGYVILLALNGLFEKASLPPMVLLYTTFPFGIFLFLVVYNLKSYKSIVAKIEIQDLVGLHSFRLIGIFFIILAYHKALPTYFALIAGLGDVITAISCFFVAWALKSKKSYAHKLTYFWNSFGLIDILITAFSANIITKLSMDTGVMGVDTLARFPFCLIPAFAPPTIVFVHVAIYTKLKNISSK